MEQEKIMRSLTIQSYHVSRVQFGDAFALSGESEKAPVSSDESRFWQLTIPQTWTPASPLSPLIKELRIRLISPENRHVPVPSIMDVIPISVKALGKIGEGVTKTLTGVYLLLTGEDETGRPLCAFGNAGGNAG